MVRTVLVVSILAVGCQHEQSLLDQPPARTTGTSGVAPSPSPSPGVAPASGGISGTVAETIDAGEYTYVRLERDGTSTWIAGPQATLAIGTKLEHLDGSAMPNFHSDRLNRTFPELYFVSGYGAAPTAAPTPAPTTATTTATGGEDLSGVVVETMDAAGYTYAQLDHAGTKVWIAGPQTTLAVGSQLGKMAGTLMTSFRSDTLKRTFDQIYFVNGFAITAGAIPNPHTPAAQAAAAAETVEKVALAPGGTTVEAVIKNKDTLVGKPVVVRGKVVKLNNGILGRNWLHLRDGSGGAGTNDLLVTTDATAAVGDIVVAHGIVATKQDFGAGYKYDVIVEKATLGK